MAMDSDILGLALAKVFIDASLEPPSPSMLSKVQEMWKAVANEIITHIQTQAELNVEEGIPVTTTGSATSQTGSTTATGTGKIL
jgi:hypothetical protein